MATVTTPPTRTDEEIQREVEAERAAWSAPGITSVENWITIAP